MDELVKKRIVGLLEAREVFVATEFDKDKCADDNFLTYNALSLADGRVVIQEFFTSDYENDTEYLFFEDGVIRDASEDEDEFWRGEDFDVLPFLERVDVEFLVCKNRDGVRDFSEERDSE